MLAGERGRELTVAGRARELLLQGTSMGGARPKAVVEDGEALCVAKFGRDEDRWNDPLVEHRGPATRRECGLNVATSRVERIGSRDVLLVRRFDRERRGTGYARSRMVSALTLLQADDQVTTRWRWSYLALADELRRVSSKPREDLHELFARICFNAAISNLDDHPRNHAIVAHDRQWRLSPAYDLTPVPAISVTRRDPGHDLRARRPLGQPGQPARRGRPLPCAATTRKPSLIASPRRSGRRGSRQCETTV